ncbi:histidine kinase dimerization/phosphoacceptor domain -containing protein [Pedobacter sp. AW31-3R]|uniref:sensor histidine kinase n=1 Tax=Pedobacter sp. AW31-3R TaxID=3445781 RepID=UPI003FA02226
MAAQLKMLIFYIFLQLSYLTLFAQTELRYSLADLKNQLQNSSDKALTATLNARISNFYIHNKIDNKVSRDSAMYYAQHALEVSENLNKQLKDKLYLSLTEVYLYKNEPNNALTVAASMSPLTRIKIMISTGAYYLYKQEEHRNDLDSAIYLLKKAITLSRNLRNQPLQHEAELYLYDALEEYGNHEGFRRGMESLIKRAEESDDFLWAASAVSRMGDHQPNGTKKLDYYRKALELFSRAGEKAEETNMIKAIGDVLLNMGKLQTAESYLLDALRRYKAMGYQNLQYTYDLLSIVNRTKGDLNTALSYAILSIKTMEHTESNASAGYFYSGLANIYAELGNTSESINYYEKAYENIQPQEYDPKLSVLKLLSEQLLKKAQVKKVFSLVNTAKKELRITALGNEIIAGIIGNAHYANGDYAKAEASYKQMIKWESRTEFNPFQSAESFNTLAGFYISRSRYTQARPFLSKILQLPQGTYPPSKLKMVYYQLYQTDSAGNDPTAALAHFKSYKQLNDSVLHAANNKNMQQLLVEYQTDQREKDNVLLRKEANLQHSKLAQAQLMTKLTVSILVAMLIIAMLVYFNYRNRQEANLQLLQHQKEITLKNASLQSMNDRQAKLLMEKEWLIKEIHHRVKNNLQVIMSLLNTQANHLENQTAIDAITDSQNRIQSIAIIHQKLFNSEDVAVINIQSYMVDLMKFLCDTFHVNQKIRFDFNIPDLLIHISQAIPIGLIINEAITNTLKYAFPDNGDGRVQLKLRELADGRIYFSIRDNGIGLSPDFVPSRAQSLGMTLIMGLGAQLNGTTEIISRNGVLIRMVFQPENLDKG